MPSRRQLLHRSAQLALLGALGPWLPRLALAEGALLSRKIPATGEALPVIGLGTSRTFNVDVQDPATMAPLQAVMDTFLAGGATLIDTAPSYGRAEEVSGALVQRAEAPSRVFWATKVSSRGREAGERQILASFDALQTRRIDLIQVHNLQDTTTQLGLLRELKQDGRVRYIGLTHYLESAHDELLAALQKEPVDFVQFNYSVGARNAERRLLPWCADNGVATLINRTFQRGQLFERVRGQSLPEWATRELDVGSWAQLMLKFVLADPAVNTVLPATSNPRYMADNLLAGHGRLPDAAQRERIAALFA